MSDHEKILKMIEEVDPADKNSVTAFASIFREWLDENVHDWQSIASKYRASLPDWKLPTHISFDALAAVFLFSRDALKAIRPEGCWIDVRTAGDGDAACKIGRNDTEGRNIYIVDTYSIGYMRSEELAELHAIIQAIAYERAQK